ncbi:MAG: hypothetical protein V7L22_25570, partial [Nostoc sp.]|uniref:hypothetical protein n=1 Tax=Nostoc sp. TaxID=1180 RepID=UPI002FF583D1
ALVLPKDLMFLQLKFYPENNPKTDTLKGLVLAMPLRQMWFKYMKTAVSEKSGSAFGNTLFIHPTNLAPRHFQYEMD